MTNGTAATSQMTNGTVSASQMTNGTVRGRRGIVADVNYKGGTSGGSQTVTIPAGIPVVAIEPGQARTCSPARTSSSLRTRLGGGS